MYEVDLKRLRSYRENLEGMADRLQDYSGRLSMTPEEASQLDAQAKEIQVEVGLIREALRRHL